MSIFHHNRKRESRSEFPPDMIPAPEMTIPQLKAFIQKCVEHPEIDWIGGNIKYVVGETVNWHLYQELTPRWKTLIIEDFDWDTFEDLRVEWEKDVTISA